jgi:GGDEF domain-containing protein
MRSGLTLFTRRRAVEPPAPERRLTEDDRRDVSSVYEAVAEALVAGRSPVAACAVVGRDLAYDGVSLGEALSGLGATHAAVGAGVPDFAAAEALSVAWSEATLEFLHDVTCEDPLTGLASAPHLRTRLAEVYRGAALEGSSIRNSHALVIVELPRRDDALRAPAFGRALGLAAIAEVVRTVFAGDETIARIGADRVAVLVRRTDALGRSVATIRADLERLELPKDASVWIEGLPGRSELGIRLLAELAR